MKVDHINRSKWIYSVLAASILLISFPTLAQEEWKPSDRTRGDLARFELLEFAAGGDKAAIRSFRFPDNADDGIYGIDVSHHNGTIDWPKVAGAGAQFVYMKSSEGARFKDKRFTANWQGAGNQKGLRRGAYHFLSADIPAKAQAENFLAHLTAVGGLRDSDLAPVLDVEWDFAKIDGKDVDRWARYSPEQIVASAKEWIDLVEKATGRKPIVYTARSWWSGRIGSNQGLIAYPHWTADYRVSSIANGVPLKVPNHSSKAWQFTDAATISGIQRKVDANKLSVSSLDDLSGR